MWQLCTSWPWSLVRWMSRGYVGACTISQAAPHLLSMPSQSLSGPFTWMAVMLPVPPTSCNHYLYVISNSVGT